MSKERLFVILEVRHLPPRGRHGIEHYRPTDKSPIDYEEDLFLHPSRIIAESRLRYDFARAGEMIFDKHTAHLWREVTIDMETCKDIILDPEPEEKDEWDEWVEDFPELYGNHEMIHDAITNWLKRMPREK